MTGNEKDDLLDTKLSRRLNASSLRENLLYDWSVHLCL